MEARKCLYCSGPIPPDKRADSKFCHNSCKAKHWEEKKGNPITKAYEATKVEPRPQLEGLRGIIDNKALSEGKDVKQTAIQPLSGLITGTNTHIPVKVETEAFKTAMVKKNQADALLKRVQNLIHLCEGKIDRLEIASKSSSPKLKSNPYKIYNVDIADNFSDDLTWTKTFFQDQDRNAKIEKELAMLKTNRKELDKWLSKANRDVDEADNNLKQMPRYEIGKTEEKSILLNILEGIKQKKLQQDERPESVEQTDMIQSEVIIPEDNVQTNNKLISSRQLRDMDYKCLNFQSRWKDLFGQPSVVFHLAVHGKPGEGKSTFCIQFADYLAKHFGKVVYISGEEGFSKTLRDKVVNNKVDNPYLFFAAYNSYEEIRNSLENRFHFIFIDSLDTLKIDAARLRELRELFPQSAFVTISQSTKDGKMRGSQEIIHDTDIAVKVEDGIASTTKNRFKEREREFQVFPDSEKSPKKLIGEPRNVV